MDGVNRSSLKILEDGASRNRVVGDRLSRILEVGGSSNSKADGASQCSLKILVDGASNHSSKEAGANRDNSKEAGDKEAKDHKAETSAF